MIGLIVSGILLIADFIASMIGIGFFNKCLKKKEFAEFKNEKL